MNALKKSLSRQKVQPGFRHARKQHLAKVIRVWLERAQDRIEKRRPLDLVEDAIRRADEALDALEKVL